MTRVLLIQHLPHEHEGVLGEVLATAGVDVTRIRAWTEPVPHTTGGADALIVLGGDMNTDQDDRWPHLKAVRALLRQAIDAAVPTLGICLGAQLLAEATGGRVTHGTPEIGWPPIRVTAEGSADPVISSMPDATPFFNAHGDYITPPARAVILAFSEAAPVHAFKVGSALGLQFHAEIDASYVAGYVEADGVAEYLAANGWTGEALVSEARRRNAAHRAAGLDLFSTWLDTVTLRAGP